MALAAYKKTRGRPVPGARFDAITFAKATCPLVYPKTLGQRGEAVAARYLHKLGYTIVARGDRSRLGEIDLIAVDDRTVVFVEVKTRRSYDAGHPVEAVGPDKQRRLTQAALTYLKAHGLLEHSARFDVVAVTWPKSTRQPKLEHFQDAFEAVGRGQMFN